MDESECERVGGAGRAVESAPPPPRPARSALLRSAFALLLLVSAAWLLGLLAVNSDELAFHYLFAAFSCLQVSGRCAWWGLCWASPGEVMGHVYCSLLEMLRPQPVKRVPGSVRTPGRNQAAPCSSAAAACER